MTVFLLIVLILEIAALWYFSFTYLRQVVKSLSEMTRSIEGKLKTVQSEVEKKGVVTDPFEAANKTHTPGASGSHIIIRKSPDQIRNENFEKIKNGGKYGQAE